MKHLKLLSLLLISILIIFSLDSCKKEDIDPCDDVTCLNGGTCLNGLCDCPPGFSGPNCGTQNLCFGINCQNGGSCINGICDCPEGYSGALCQNEVTPRTMKIIKLELIEFPPTASNGAGWDVSSGPDIYTTITYNGNQIYESGYHQNATVNFTYPFTINGNLNLNNVTDKYEIRIFDYDEFDSDDYMGGISWTPYRDGLGFPQIVTLDANQGVAFRITYSYVW